MAPISVLIVVDGFFSLTTTYPIDPSKKHFAPSDQKFGPDAWFTLSHLIKTLRDSPSPTFTVHTASRGFNLAGIELECAKNTVLDPDATIERPFHFDDPRNPLAVYDEIWLFGHEGYAGGDIFGPRDPTTGEIGGLTQTELTAITNFMQAGGGLFAVGDHDGLGSGMCGRIPRVRYMRKWYSQADKHILGKPPLAVTNWPGLGPTRRDTLQRGKTDDINSNIFFFDDQSDDIPQPLNVLLPEHPVVQGATGVLRVYPDHVHEGEVIVPTGPQLKQTCATDSTLSFAHPGFTEFPWIGEHQEVPQILAQSYAGSGGGLHGHVTVVPDGRSQENWPCEKANFKTDSEVCDVIINNTLAAYDGAKVNVGRIVTDSSFHHFIDLNLLGDPCSRIPTKQQGFNASPEGQAYLKEISAFYVNVAKWLAWKKRA